MTVMQTLLLFLAVFLITSILFRIPMAFSMGITCVVIVILTGQPGLSLAQTAFSSLDSMPFLAIPFFVFAGALMQYSGLSKQLVNWVAAVVGRVRGSLGVLVVVASAAFGVLTGSTNATLSSIGKMLVPELVDKGYKKSYATALAAASGFLGILIPPSVPGIFYALAAGQDISAVWISTIGPAILICVGYIIVNYLRHGRREEKPTEPFQFPQYIRNMGSSTVSAIPALIMPILIFGGIYGGFCTPTEAGVVCCAYGVIFYIIQKLRKRKPAKGMWDIVVESAGMTAVICILCAFSNSAGRTLTRVGVSGALSELITAHVNSPIVFLLLCNVVFLFLGMLIDINSSILIMTPLLLPTVLAYDIEPIHFGAIMLVNLCVGYLTPPMCSSVYLMCRLCDESFTDVVKELWPFIVVGLSVVLLVTFVPALSIGVVNLVG